jgi:hypothetical protein
MDLRDLGYEFSINSGQSAQEGHGIGEMMQALHTALGNTAAVRQLFRTT